MTKFCIILLTLIFIRSVDLAPIPSNVYIGQDPNSIQTPIGDSVSTTLDEARETNHSTVVLKTTAATTTTSSPIVLTTTTQIKPLTQVQASTSTVVPLKVNHSHRSFVPHSNYSSHPMNYLNISKFTVQELIKYVWVIPFFVVLIIKSCLLCHVVHNMKKIQTRLRYLQNGINETNKLHRYNSSQSPVPRFTLTEPLDDQNYNIPTSPVPSSIPPPPPMPTYPITIRWHLHLWFDASIHLYLNNTFHSFNITFSNKSHKNTTTLIIVYLFNFALSISGKIKSSLGVWYGMVVWWYNDIKFSHFSHFPMIPHFFIIRNTKIHTFNHLKIT